MNNPFFYKYSQYVEINWQNVFVNLTNILKKAQIENNLKFYEFYWLKTSKYWNKIQSHNM